MVKLQRRTGAVIPDLAEALMWMELRRHATLEGVANTAVALVPDAARQHRAGLHALQQKVSTLGCRRRTGKASAQCGLAMSSREDLDATERRCD
mmetsp:Transcript_73091/g.169459  ORF Transcript_73091/g.169459 Transcript_73091/m.169459 type:complete len:94 (-) Transcript_73091:134-415(-)